MRSNNNPILIIYHFLFALSSSVVGAILASWPLLLIFVVVQKTYESVKLSILGVMQNYGQLMWYLLNPFQRKLKMTDLPTSTGAAKHFADCKGLFIFSVFVFIICLVLFLIGKKKKQSRLLKLDKSWALFFLILPVVILPFAMTNFDSFFVVFHHILFSDSNWLFNPVTDPIINVLTEGFFAACFAVAGIIYELYFAAQLLSK